MIFVWLAIGIGIALMAGLIEAVSTEAREEHDEAVIHVKRKVIEAEKRKKNRKK